ncbi:putative membrane protein [Salmonella phage SilasIsHot]|nr:putative membrane protein [Salmonella phage SilasIsHot]
MLLITAFIWVKGFLTFLHSLSAMISFYAVSPHSDVNVRAANQSDMLAEYVMMRDKATRIVLFSTLAGAVIIFIQHVLEATHAVL